MKRLFVAIKINPDKTFINLFDQIKQKTINDKVKWVNTNNIHITLKFLGETEEPKIDSIKRMINQSLQDTPKFQIEISEVGIFGSSYQPKAIWFGVKNNKELIKASTKIIDNLDAIGFLKDRQNFVPHITLGRINYINDKKMFQNMINQLKSEHIQVVEIDEVILYESILKKEGPIYIEIEKFKLIQ